MVAGLEARGVRQQHGSIALTGVRMHSDRASCTPTLSPVLVVPRRVHAIYWGFAMSGRSHVLLALAVALVASSARGQVTIGTTGPATRSEQFGTDPTATLRVDVGQSFVVPVGAASLTSLSFWSGATFSNAGDFFIRVYQFDPAVGPTGAALYVSGPVAPHASPGAPPPPTVRTTVFPSSLSLMPGASYFFLITSFPPICCARSPRLIFVDEIVPDGAVGGYASGSLWRSRPADRQLDPLALTFDRGDGDLRFEATFTSAATSVPEASTVALLGAGLAAVGGVAARRRRGR